jgi:hypothetical protein
MTACAVVTLTGIPSGIYLMREPVNEEFLVRNFGPATTTATFMSSISSAATR